MAGNHTAIPQKIKHRITPQSSNPTSGCTTRRRESRVPRATAAPTFAGPSSQRPGGGRPCVHRQTSRHKNVGCAPWMLFYSTLKRKFLPKKDKGDTLTPATTEARGRHPAPGKEPVPRADGTRPHFHVVPAVSDSQGQTRVRRARGWGRGDGNTQLRL